MAVLIPDFIDDMSWEMAEVFGAVTDQIMINLAHYFPYWKPGQPVPKSTFEYQANMLAQMGQVNRETIRIISTMLKGADSTLANTLEQAIIGAVKKAQPDLLKAVKAGILQPVDPTIAPNQMRAFQLYYQQAAQKLNLVNTVMLESTRQAYQATVADIANRVQATQTALDIAAGETVTGVSTWNQAAQHAIERLKENGITGFIDHAGRHWSAEAYTAMDIRTTVANTARAAVWETNENFGNDLYQVSYHNGARPLCYPWQNKVISSTDNARTVTDLDGNEIQVIAQSSTSYGQAAGLFGVNCKHYPTPFIPGVSVIRGEPQDEKANAKTYAESQEQRRLERRVREEKRDLLMEKARGAPQEVIDAQQDRVRAAQADVQSFCDKTGRARHKDREGVYTKRKFPNPDTYDAAEFKRTQQKQLQAYFKNYGAQPQYNVRYNAAQMTPKVPIQPTAKSVAPKPKAQTAKKPVQRPANEPDFLKQFKRYDPATKTAAEKLAQVNPNFQKGTLQWTYNCQRTVAAQEMVYRGYDVTAMPYNRADAIASSGTAVWKVRSDFWKDPDCTILQRSSFVDTIESTFDKWGDGSRAIVRLKWSRNHGNSGHFIFARRENGQVFFEDPQSNRRLDITQTLKRTTTSKNQMWVLRVDNREVNDNIVLAIKNAGE